MATTLNLLSTRAVHTLGPGSHADGGNLYLRVKDSGARSWVFRYKAAGRVKEVGLGPLHSRPLAEARKLAAAMRRAVIDGKDPAELLHKPEPMKGATFADCAADLIENKRSGWRNPKHAQQWSNTLRDYAFPVIGHKAPADVTLDDMKAILTPIWATKTETATRLRQRIEAVLDYAAVHKLCRSENNPARWKGMLDKVLADPGKLKKASLQHHAAADYADVPRIMAALSEARHVSALCLRFLILTAARSGEARGCQWAEIDRGSATWRVPAQRMKAAQPHHVPLSSQALDVLSAAESFRRMGADWVFPGPRGGPLSDVALSKALHAIAPGVTVHGFRSAFRTWAEKETQYGGKVAEAALAHVNADKVEAAYLRTDLFEKRAKLMQAWADYLDSLRTGTGRVVAIRGRAA